MLMTILSIIPIPEIIHAHILLYPGPDTILPLASILGALIGMLLISWRFIRAGIGRVYRTVTGKPEPVDPDAIVEESVESEETD